MVPRWYSRKVRKQHQPRQRERANPGVPWTKAPYQADKSIARVARRVPGQSKARAGSSKGGMALRETPLGEEPCLNLGRLSDRQPHRDDFLGRSP